MLQASKILIVAIVCGTCLAGEKPDIRQPAPSKTASAEKGSPPFAKSKKALPKQTALVYKLGPELIAAIDARNLAPARDALRTKLTDALADFDQLDRAKVVSLATSFQFARFFSRVEAPTDANWAALKKLSDRPHFATRLMLGLSSYDAPDKVLDVVAAVCNEDGKNRNLDDWADLAAALCVVWDAPAGNPEIDEENERSDTLRAGLLFRYYTNAAARLQFDPKQLPFELLVYVVDNVVDQGEIAWAFDQYGKRASVAGVYFDVPYDLDGLYISREGRAIKGTYTLPNLRIRGGICADQAYFATMVGRSLGVPSVTSTGRGSGSDGSGHAWVGYLDRNIKGTRWNFLDGRYESQQYFRGDVIDPQTRLRVPESEVALSAESLHVPNDDRLLSSALVASVDLVDDARKADVLMRAINLYSGNRVAWDGLSKLGADRALTPAQADQIATAVVRTMTEPYPEFALEILTKLNSGRGTQQQFAALEKMKDLFKSRPDLLADLTLAQGDLRKRERKNDEALQLYGSVIERRLSMAPIVMAAMEKVDTLLTETGETARLADAYQKVWTRMPAPDVTTLVRTTPYFILGRRYASTLGQLNTREAAAELTRVETKLESLEAATTASRR